jgi:hypothetical protein
MRIHLLAGVLSTIVYTATATAAPPLDVELATERGMQITAPREWLQLFADLGIENVRIRSATGTDKPLVDNRGDAANPRFHVVGILTANEELVLPGGRFTSGDRQKIADYFARLSADGAEAMTAQRGRFGLTEQELAAAHAELAQPLGFATKGQSLRAVLDRAQAKLNMRLVPDAAAEQIIRTAGPVADDVENLTAGTGLAIVLQSFGLALRPERKTGQRPTLGIVPIDAADDRWPIGWDPTRSPGQTAPALMEFINVEIEGYTLAEAMNAMQPRVKLPFYWDHAALAKDKIDPAKIQVHIPRTRTFYKRILDRALMQAHLAGKLRIDEAGTPFFWISR